MGFLQLLKFSLLCVDFLAWPLIALGYPLFASIRAIETGSKYHTKKLVIYWTMFSLVSLVEYALVKVIEWVPFWSSVRLVAVFWLVFPRFQGACCAYRSFVRPYLVVSLQEVIDSICKANEDASKERFLDVADKYISENGSEALEKLIASKGRYVMVLKEPDSFQIGTRVMKPAEEYVVAASKQLKESDHAAQKDKEMLEVLHNIASPEAKQMLLKEPYDSQIDTRIIEPVEQNVQAVSKQLKEPAQKGKEMLEDLHMIASPEAKQVPHPRLLTAASWVPKQTNPASATTKDIEITPPPENEHPATTSPPPLKKTDPEWACHICQLTTTCEKNLNDHLQGKKHKSKCGSLNTPSNHLNARDEVTTSDSADQNAVGDDGSKFDLWCNVCDLKLLSEVDVESHLKGKRHSSNLKRLEKVECVVVS